MLTFVLQFEFPSAGLNDAPSLLNQTPVISPIVLLAHPLKAVIEFVNHEFGAGFDRSVELVLGD